MIYLVISFENFCVYTMAKDVVIAIALVAGMPDSFVKGVSEFNSADYHKIISKKYFYNNIIQINKGRGTFTEVAPESVSNEWKNNQTIIKLRQDLFAYWNTYVNSALTRSTKHAWRGFSDAVCRELDKCDPANKKYSILIDEYADIQDLPVDQAYKTLKLEIESDIITKFRITAFADKWKNVINQVATRQEVEDINQKMIIDFWSNMVL